MLQSIASYLWGANEPVVPKADVEEETEEVFVEFEYSSSEREDTDYAVTDTDTDAETDTEWIVVPTKDIESDFSEQSGAEDDMVVEHGTQENEDENGEKKSKEATMEVVAVKGRKENRVPTGGKRRVLLKRALMKDWNDKVVLLRKDATPKKLRRINMVRVRVNNAKKNKQIGRMEGKHTGVAGQRAK